MTYWAWYYLSLIQFTQFLQKLQNPPVRLLKGSSHRLLL
jgi:hypothetical protein